MEKKQLTVNVHATDANGISTVNAYDGMYFLPGETLTLNGKVQNFINEVHDNGGTIDRIEGFFNGKRFDMPIE